MRCVAWNPDGSRLATSGDDGIIKIRSTHSGDEILTMHDSTLVGTITFSPDGKLLASCGNYDHPHIRIRDAASGHLVHEFRNAHHHAITALDWNSDGVRLASASSDQYVKLWNIQSKKMEWSAGLKAPVSDVKWNPISNELATASTDGLIQVWDAETASVLNQLRGHQGPVNSISWRQDGKRIVSGSSDGTLKLWDPTHHQAFTFVDGRLPIFNSDGTQLAMRTQEQADVIVIVDSTSATNETSILHSECRGRTRQRYRMVSG